MFKCIKDNIKYVIELQKISETGKYRTWGRLHDLDGQNTVIEEKKYMMERIIDFDLVRENVSQLFQMISDGVVYLNHIPYSSNNRLITPDRFVMITAAFEWEFRHIYGKLSSEEHAVRREAREELNEFINQKIQVTQGKKKKYFKSYKKFLLFDMSNSSFLIEIHFQSGRYTT